MPRILLAQGAAAGLLGLLAAELILGPATMPFRLRLITAGVCALQSTHMLHLGAAPLPLCARDTGIFLGLAITYLYTAVRARNVPALNIKLVATLIGLATPMAIDGLNSLAFDLGLSHFYPPQNLLRLATGLLAGLAMAVFLLSTSAFLKNSASRRSTRLSVADLLIVSSVLAALFALIAIGHDLLWPPVALFSAGGVVLAIYVVNTWVITAGSRNHLTAGAVALFGVLAGVLELLFLSTLRLTLLPIS